jgi:dipeptide/tripeptide permease
MIKCAVEDYKLIKDDMLIDSLSSLFNIALDLGEIIGPIFAGFATSWLGYNLACTVVGLILFTYAIIYALGSGVLKCKKINSHIIKSTPVIKFSEFHLST